MKAASPQGQSALLDELIARRREIAERMKPRKTLQYIPLEKLDPPPPPPPPINFPPLPQQNIKSLEGRIVEAKALFHYLPYKKLKRITDDIFGSSADCGERPVLCGPMPDQFCPIVKIQTIVARHYNKTLTDILARRNFASVVRPRQIAMYLSKTITSLSLTQIGQRFGGRDHATVIHAIRKITKRMAEDPVFAEEIERLKGMLSK